ncbi:MAG: hypothetical protein ICV59_05315 [Thermoleophilia bacterium]|nr:hypothetical protein [Thermoleophilia bacterium]
MVRLRAIEDLTADHLAKLAVIWHALADLARGDADRFARAWRAAATAWDFGQTNALIVRHNRYFPIEARLPMDPRTGDFALVDGRPYTREPLDAEWVLERFPPVLDGPPSAARDSLVPFRS